jgi:hypothetical protein
MAGVQLPARIFSSPPQCSDGSGAHQASYPMGTEDDFTRVKPPGRETDHSLPTSAEVKEGKAMPPFPHACLHGIVLN